MQTLQYSYRGLGLLMRLNWDRALSAFAIFIALMAGAWIAVAASEQSTVVCNPKIESCSSFSSF
ncbi:hypothetical protein DL239_18540 [Sedimentitalea sp. CY04]|uniref:Uncharacterized protein n=1 Tax=Parasedimentitalea denitrificans TaxID=2211118 RepID=A0ABX0WDM9_9RHOB|nr:hypothetical protein [Sedimentitalea sp. CY04]